MRNFMLCGLRVEARLVVGFFFGGGEGRQGGHERSWIGCDEQGRKDVSKQGAAAGYEQDYQTVNRRGKGGFSRRPTTSR